MPAHMLLFDVFKPSKNQARFLAGSYSGRLTAFKRRRPDSVAAPRAKMMARTTPKLSQLVDELLPVTGKTAGSSAAGGRRTASMT